MAQAVTNNGARVSALKFHLTPVSANAKTGAIPVSTSSAATCPASCPFMGKGCYAASGPLAIHWRAVTAGDRGNSWRQFIAAIAALPARQLWRHNQAGDLVNPATATGRRMLAQLTEANRGRRGYTYTHHKRTPAAIAALKAATAQGFTVNASCHSETEADAAIAQGLRAVFVVPASEPRRFWSTAGGNRVVVCPAQYRAGVTCDSCRLCQARPEHIAVAFLAHGTGRRAAELAIAAAP